MPIPCTFMFTSLSRQIICDLRDKNWNIVTEVIFHSFFWPTTIPKIWKVVLFLHFECISQWCNPNPLHTFMQIWCAFKKREHLACISACVVCRIITHTHISTPRQSSIVRKAFTDASEQRAGLNLFVELSLLCLAIATMSGSALIKGVREAINASWSQVKGFTHQVTYHFYFLTCALAEAEMEH